MSNYMPHYTVNVFTYACSKVTFLKVAASSVTRDGVIHDLRVLYFHLVAPNIKRNTLLCHTFFDAEKKNNNTSLMCFLHTEGSFYSSLLPDLWMHHEYWSKGTFYKDHHQVSIGLLHNRCRYLIAIGIIGVMFKHLTYRQTSNIRRTLLGNNIVHH